MGRHSAPDDDAVEHGAVDLVDVDRDIDQDIATGTSGRHASLDLEPPRGPSSPDSLGLDVIEDAMSEHPTAGDEAEVAADTDVERTGQIQAIADPELDRPVPDAETAKFAPVRDDPAVGSAPLTWHTAQAPAAPVDDEPDRDAQKAARKEQKAAEAARKRADKQAAKAASRAEKAELKQLRDARKTQPADTTQTAVIRDDAGESAAAEADTGELAVQPETQVETAGITETEETPEAKQSDLDLLRRDGAARARVIAAILVPFVLYLGVLAVIGEFELRTVLIWIWIPMITAGIVAGLMLDLGHRAAAARALEALEARDGQPDDAQELSGSSERPKPV